MDDNHHNIWRSKSDSGTLHYKPQSSKDQFFKNFPEILDLPDTDTVYDSPTSFAKQSNSSP